MLNKVLKDIVVRSQLIMGKRAVFRPGWDCHGLPIEQQVEKDAGQGRQGAGRAWRSASTARRTRCKFVDVMRTEFKRLGCVGNWDDPYLTLSKDYEATIARQLAGFVRARPHLPRQEAGALVSRPPHRAGRGRGRIRRTQLAVDLRPLPDRRRSGQGRPAAARRKPAAFVIWTTTPWTLPANLAVVANPELDYVAIPHDGEYLIVAAGLAESFLAATGIAAPPDDAGSRISRDGLRALEGTTVPRRRSRARTADAERDYRLWFARHATLEAGTGLVHTAPGHGADDYVVGREHGLRDLRARRRARPVHAPRSTSA